MKEEQRATTLQEMAKFCEGKEKHIDGDSYIYSSSASGECVINLNRLEKIPNYYAYVDKKTDIVYSVDCLYYRLYGQYNKISTGINLEK